MEVCFFVFLQSEAKSHLPLWSFKQKVRGKIIDLQLAPGFVFFFFFTSQRPSMWSEWATNARWARSAHAICCCKPLPPVRMARARTASAHVTFCVSKILSLCYDCNYRGGEEHGLHLIYGGITGARLFWETSASACRIINVSATELCLHSIQTNPAVD